MTKKNDTRDRDDDELGARPASSPPVSEAPTTPGTPYERCFNAIDNARLQYDRDVMAGRKEADERERANVAKKNALDRAASLLRLDISAEQVEDTLAALAGAGFEIVTDSPRTLA